MVEDKTNIVAMLQGDMLAFRKPGEPLQIAFPDRYDTKELTELAQQVSRSYVPNATVGFTPVCCSDHQSFWEQGFPSTWFFERNGNIADDRYHDSGDLVDRVGYDFDEYVSVVRAMVATLATVAELE
mmetsp:Transcript_30089/g.70799  ORF Transcript_30089/g.70799 Transcript_30089/m.70799 type:complete len:127 (-) Transcript_30089:29-409(-)